MSASFHFTDERPHVWLAGAAVALLAHLGVIAAIALRFNWTVYASSPLATAMTVEVAELPSAPPVPEVQTAPGPKRVESRPTPRRTPTPENKKIDAPVKITAAAVAVLVRKQDQSVPDPDPTRAPSASDTTSPTAPSAKQTKETKAPAEGTPTTRPGTKEQIWEAKVLTRLERYKRYPVPAQRQHIEDTVFLDFVVDRQGNVLSSRIDRSAGHELLDAEVLTLVQRASPYPAPPNEVIGRSIELIVPIEFFIKNPQLPN